MENIYAPLKRMLESLVDAYVAKNEGDVANYKALIEVKNAIGDIKK